MGRGCGGANFGAKARAGNSVGRFPPLPLIAFRLNDCTTDDCEAIEPSRINLALKTTTDGCAIHDTRIDVSMSIRLHRDWIMCDVFVIIGTRWVWTAVMPEADALAHIIRHKGRVYAPRDDDSIPF